MRTFIAIDLTDPVREKILHVQDCLQKCDLDVKWVRPQNAHITLKFLGWIKDPDKIEKIKKAIEEVTIKFRCLDVNLKEFGFFPNEKRPRVFFISTDKEDALKAISCELEEKLEKLGFEKEGRFRSHITIARFKSLKNIDCLSRELKNIDLRGSLQIKDITLFKSTLKNTGPVYEIIFKSILVS
jgi:2'-5' RNA ligase